MLPAVVNSADANEALADNFSNLAVTWERLAAELESTEALLDAYQLEAEDSAQARINDERGCACAPPNIRSLNSSLDTGAGAKAQARYKSQPMALLYVPVQMK